MAAEIADLRDAVFSSCARLMYRLSPMDDEVHQFVST
jgi:hypothetical protein